ncbi:protein obstructor-E-like [Brevipalpus obovatus]|uniref:protein obstructor-E-like n=1 Tax=Brevipalpus obovatus TaxID=246614 RepID=UPI003D9F93BB
MFVLLTASILAVFTGISCQRAGPQFQFSPANAQPPPQPQNFQQPPPQPQPARREPPPTNLSPREALNSQPRPVASNFACPEKTGFFPHAKSCDKYYACENSTAILKTCGNGLVFDDQDYMRENCAYPFSVDCGDRTDMEPPISTPNCPRLYGIFAHSSNCRIFYSCWNGEANKYECPPGLAYDDEQRVCVWADLVNRCDQASLSDGFVCPDNAENDQPGHYTRHPHPTDCRKFYVCIDGVARPYGCSFGTVFNVDTLQCDEPENVQGCEKYYGDIDPKTAKKLKGQN